MRTSTFRFTVAVFALLGLASASAMAGSILVNNNNFSTFPSTGLNINSNGGPYSEYAGIPGWTATGATGEWATNGIALSLPAGATAIAYSNGNTISQKVTPTVVAGDTYTLSVDIGDRKGISPFPGGADLLIGGVAYDATGTPPILGGWSDYTVSYTGVAATAGDSITIQLTDHGLQTDFSDVTLSSTAPLALGSPATATPEPSTLSLAGLGLLCAMGYGLRKSVA